MPEFRLFRNPPSALLAAGWLLSGCAGSQPGRIPLADIGPLFAAPARMQNVSGFDVYVDGGAVHAVFTAGTGKPALIAYLHSADGGRHWSQPVDIGKDFDLPVESKLGNDAQLAVSGSKFVVMWQTTGELPGMGPLVTIFSADGGLTWRRGGNPGTADTDQSHADLAADSSGRFHAVWLDDRDENGHQGLRYARSSDIGDSWQAQQTVDDATCSCCWNRLLVTPDGLLNVLYRDMEPRDMALAQSQDGGDSWRRLATVGAFGWKFDGCPHNGGGLTQAAGGDLHAVVWTGAEGRSGLYHLQSADAGQDWTLPQPVAAGSGAFHADIAAADAGRLVMVWDALGPEGSAVFFASSQDDGRNWSEPGQLSAPGVAAGFPRVVATGDGWLALWTEQGAGKSRQWRSAVIE